MSEKIGVAVLGLGVVLLNISVSQVSAETITSPSYKIDGNFGGSFGGRTESTSYKMTAIGGESIVGSGSSGSYIIDQQPTSAAAQAMQLSIQPTGLVGFYPMDEGVGTTASDASRYQNDGTLKTTAAWSASGKLGGAVDINGPIDTSGDGSINIPDHINLPSGSQMTFEAWINPRDSTVTKAIATHHAGSDHSWRIYMGGGNILVYIASSPTDSSNYLLTNTNEVAANVWQHVSVVYDGSLPQADKVKVYLNGIRKTANTTGSFPSSLRNSAGVLSIGALSGLNGAFPGLIDHVKLFNRALNSAEIAAEYEAQSAGVTTGLSLGTETNESKVSQVDAIVRTNVGGYSLAIHQDHDLQNGANTIPAISGGSIASPLAWSDGVTKGLGFTLMNAPNLDSKWGSGISYAALPLSATTFYTNTNHVTSNVDVVNARLRLDTDTPQAPGSYTNNITYTGTMIP